MLCGGVGAAKPADLEVTNIINKTKDAVLAHTNQSYDTYEAHSYSTQVVAGRNYFVKVKVGDDDYIHVRIYQPLPPNHDNHEVHGVQSGKTLDDAIHHF